VRATGINHVSISAADLAESTSFYEEVFGMERLPTPTFPDPVQWLRLGDLQLHLFLDGETPPARHHIGITIDDFDAAYQAVKARASDEFGWQLVELPSRQVQLYFRDPAGNLIELDFRDATRSCNAWRIMFRSAPTRSAPRSSSRWSIASGALG
jgi:catechol 2,3-dioxygenase-like lactoylglutathione lyase family enzyme